MTASCTAPSNCGRRPSWNSWSAPTRSAARNVSRRRCWPARRIRAAARAWRTHLIRSVNTCSPRATRPRRSSPRRKILPRTPERRLRSGCIKGALRRSLNCASNRRPATEASGGGRPDRGRPPPSRNERPLELITEGDGEDSRPKRGLLDYELIGAREGGGMGIGEILTGKRHSPRVLRNAGGRIDGRVGGILEPQSAGADGSGLCNRGVRTRLGERIVGVGDTHLSKGGVGAHIPIVAGAHAELHRRRVGTRGAGRAERGGGRCE